MNIVYNLSNALDFKPVFDRNIPLELFPIDGKSLFEGLHEKLEASLPDEDYYVIDSSLNPSFHTVDKKLDVLNLPSVNMLTKMILFSSFTIAYELNPLSLFMPANIYFQDVVPLTASVSNAAKSSLLRSSITFIGARRGRYSDYVEKGDLIVSDQQLEIYGIKKICSSATVTAWKEKNPDRKESLFFLGSSRIVLFNALKLQEFISAFSEELYDIMVMLIGAWKDGRSINTVLRDTIEILDGYTLEDLLQSVDEKFTVGFIGEFLEVNSIETLMCKLPLDKSRNWVEGPAKLEHVMDSFIVNRGPGEISIKGVQRLIVLSKGGDTAIKGIF